MREQDSVLVVDDDESILDYCVWTLGSYGFRVASASSGKKALSRLKSEAFSIVLTDHVTVGAQATPILKIVRSLQPSAGIILMSAIPTLKEASRSYLAGAAAYLAKPFTEQQLAAAMLQCLQAGSQARSDPARLLGKDSVAGTPNVWYRELFLEFENGSRQRFHIERKPTGTHDPRLQERPAPWTSLEFQQCPSCPLRGPGATCPAAVSIQMTLDKLRDHRSFERVKATAVDARGRSQTVEWPLQQVGSVLVQLAVFASGCPVGSECKPHLEGLPPFASAQVLSRHILSRILGKHHGAWESARSELQGVLGLLHEVFLHLLQRLRQGGAPLTRDAVPNSIVHMDTFVQTLSIRADALFQSMAAELGWDTPPGSAGKRP